MRTRLVVALSALIAVGALVALAGTAASHAPSSDRSVDAGLFRLLVPADPLRTTATTTHDLDPAYDSAGSLGTDAPLREPDRRAVPPARPEVNQPAPGEGAVSKNPWRRDPNVSFYGPGFYGKRTACGHAYTTTIQGVAHRTLPCGTKVTFRNPDNGRTITVPVIDRGPYVAGRQWDLSGATCTYLRACRTGPLLWRFPG